LSEPKKPKKIKEIASLYISVTRAGLRCTVTDEKMLLFLHVLKSCSGSDESVVLLDFMFHIQSESESESESEFKAQKGC
jgi:hypothetical protein